MVKQCPLRLTEADKTCQKNDCEWFIKYRIGDKETKECALVCSVLLKMPPAGAATL